ncbi:hydrolase [Brevibacterium sp. ZH18]|uniref:hydrolase n=1 Tax=Brevibacterium sp. ZH18 TaxID=2927784 RepID=UPI001F624A62|nr:hydrolase [Brevibacterium sp. ZH18]MCI4012216.1 hydrolase [Brevibacterium sp. ZH18]
MSALTNATICRTCGVETSTPPPAECPICTDERQWVPAAGQSWTTREELESEGHRLVIEEREPGLYALHVEPRLGIGQTCYLAQTPHGNLLFDVPPYIDDDAVAAVTELGGVQAIAASHPHMFGVQLEWSAAFEAAPILVCRTDADWVQRQGPNIWYFYRESQPFPGTSLYRTGGHFAGSIVGLWTGADGKGVMLSGDTIGPVARDGWVTFMRSFPNYLPLSANVVRRIAASVADLDFDRMYGNFGRQISSGAKEAVQSSAQRYAEWVSGEHDDLT